MKTFQILAVEICHEYAGEFTDYVVTLNREPRTPAEWAEVSNFVQANFPPDDEGGTFNFPDDADEGISAAKRRWEQLTEAEIEAEEAEMIASIEGRCPLCGQDFHIAEPVTAVEREEEAKYGILLKCACQPACQPAPTGSGKNPMNKWTNGSQIIVSEAHPGEYWFPVVSERRVSGSTYTPYTRGSAAWVKAANAALASIARANFETRR